MQKPQKAAKTLNKQTNKIIKKRFSQISRLNDTNENTVRCDYYDLNDFNKVIVIKQDLAVLHLNISSLSSHHNELKLLLPSRNLNVGIICIKERQRFTKELQSLAFQPATYIFLATATNKHPHNLLQVVH